MYDSLEKGGSAARNALRADEIVEENTGFAIVINGHSLVHCLSPELESRQLLFIEYKTAIIYLIIYLILASWTLPLSAKPLYAVV